MEYGLPETSSEFSREGVLLHNYTAHPEYDRSVLSPNLRDLLERNDALIKVIRERIGRDLREITSHTSWTELPLSNDIISGQPDILEAYDGERKSVAAWINDTKFGYNVVERADLNLQLRVYAVLTYDYLQPLPPDKIFVSIAQPRLPYDERITVAVYDPEQIEAAREEIAAILRRAGHDRAKLVAGEEQCRYCRAKLTCPAFAKTLTVPVTALRPAQDLSKTAREAYLEKRLAELPDAGLEKVLIACSLAGMVKPLANDEARKRIAAGGLAKFKLSKPGESREIVDPQRAISLLEIGGVATREAILSFCTIPLGKLEETYRKAHPGLTWNEAREKIGKVLASVIETTEQKPKVLRK